MHPIQKLLLLIVLLPYCTQGQIITTVAGNGVASYTGDGGPATAASMYHPRHVTLDKSGNLYIADEHYCVIRKVDTFGVISTYAGSSNGFSGDGGAATDAQLSVPLGLACDRHGNLYIADRQNSRIRKVDASGIITTIAGTGIGSAAFGYNGDGIPATAALLYRPNDVAVDSAGNVYVSEQNNYRIRKIDVSGIITTIAGNGTFGYSGDGGAATAAQLQSWGMALDKYNNIYFSDSSYRIRKISTGGIISTIAGNGTLGYSGDGGIATAAQFDYTEGLTVDDTGNVYICDAGNHRIRKITTTGMIIRVAGIHTGGFSGDNGDPLLANLVSPSGIVIGKGGNIYIADLINFRVRCIGCSKSLGVIEVEEKRGNYFSVSPNPVTGGLLKVLLHSVVNEEVGISITDVLGKVVVRTTVYTNTESNLPLRLPAGVYYLEAVTGMGRVAERIVVE